MFYFDRSRNFFLRSSLLHSCDSYIGLVTKDSQEYECTCICSGVIISDHFDLKRGEVFCH